MAGPVGHILTALMVLNSGMISVSDEPAFIAGNCFPDIRYFGVIERTKTHEKNISFNQVKTESDPFKAGMLLHSLVDLAREEHMIANNAYDHLPNTRFKSQMLKFIEDIILYDYVSFFSSWPIIISYFDTIYPQELVWGIDREDVQKWHSIIQSFCHEKPNAATLSNLLGTVITSDWMKIAIINGAVQNLSMLPLKFIENLKNNEKLKQIIFDFYLKVPERLIEFTE